MNLFLFGIIFAFAAAAALFFFQFWRRTKDQLFLWFSFAFVLFAIERLVMASAYPANEYQFYLIRLAGFLSILIAIIQKNRLR